MAASSRSNFEATLDNTDVVILKVLLIHFKNVEKC